jgi:hypothetical protein
VNFIRLLYQAEPAKEEGTVRLWLILLRYDIIVVLCAERELTPDEWRAHPQGLPSPLPPRTRGEAHGSTDRKTLHQRPRLRPVHVYDFGSSRDSSDVLGFQLPPRVRGGGRESTSHAGNHPGVRLSFSVPRSRRAPSTRCRKIRRGQP